VDVGIPAGGGPAEASAVVSLPGLCDDLLAETEVLDDLVRPLDEAGWHTPTPAPGWTIRDQVVHLARTDEAARLSAVDPDDFTRWREEVRRDRDAVMARLSAEDRDKSGAEVLAWLHRARRQLVDDVRDLDPKHRVPWFGPDMTVVSSITARIMETWAHGQDCFDALERDHPASGNLRHVALIGTLAFANSFRAKGREVPDVRVRVELDAPGGGRWVFGSADATEIVRGTAEDFCLVVTQRRHLADTDLVAEGDVAAEWLTIAQAYAGTGGAGRRPGQFPRRPPRLTG
jgi:uncharacterized protein (TIGR03084 family)